MVNKQYSPLEIENIEKHCEEDSEKLTAKNIFRRETYEIVGQQARTIYTEQY